MIIKKVTVNDEIIHVSISKDEAIKCLKNNEELIFTDEVEKDELFKSLNSEQKDTHEERHKSRSKSSKLVSMLPFLDDEDIHQLMEKILAKDELFKDLNIMSMLPFLSSEDASRLFRKALEQGSDINPIQIAPFIDDEELSIVIDDYMNGKYPDLDVDSLYPFLSSKDVKRLFEYMLTH